MLSSFETIYIFIPEAKSLQNAAIFSHYTYVSHGDSPFTPIFQLLRKLDAYFSCSQFDAVIKINHFWQRILS